jgi:hypothetical protein
MTSEPVPAGTKTVSFRRAFLIGYANTIGGRLADAKTPIIETTSSSTAIVLADRTERINHWVTDTYGRLRRHRDRTPVSSKRGHAAGERAAADADLTGSRNGVTPSPRAVGAGT